MLNWSDTVAVLFIILFVPIYHNLEHIPIQELEWDSYLNLAIVYERYSQMNIYEFSNTITEISFQ